MHKVFFILATSIILTIPSYGYCQYTTANESIEGTFGINAGVNLPLGEFAMEDGQYAGGAQTGVNFGIEFVALMRKVANFNWVSTLLLLINPVDLPGGFYEIGITGDEKPWVHLGLLVGGRYKFINRKNMKVYGLLQGGMLYGVSPEIKNKQLINNALFTTVHQRSGSAWAVAGNAAIGVNLWENFDVRLKYLRSNNFTYEVRTLGRNETTISEEFRVVQPVSTLNLTLSYYL